MRIGIAGVQQVVRDVGEGFAARQLLQLAALVGAEIPLQAGEAVRQAWSAHRRHLLGLRQPGRHPSAVVQIALVGGVAVIPQDLL